MFVYAMLLLLPALILAADDPLAALESKLFHALDASKDGKITKLETENYFLGFDTDKDGAISKDEFKSSVDKLDPEFAGHEDDLFKLLDRDIDGKVNKADIDAVYALGNANKDGGIDRGEFHVMFNLVVTTIG